MQIPADPYLLLFEFWQKFGQSVYLKPAIIIGSIFFFVVLIALVRKHIFQLSMRGAVFGFVAGIIVMLILDLIIIFGIADKTKVSKLSASENRQEAVQEIFISGISNLGNVLGVSTTARPKTQKPKALEEVISGYLSLPSSDAEKFKVLLCPQ